MIQFAFPQYGDLISACDHVVKDRPGGHDPPGGIVDQGVVKGYRHKDIDCRRRKLVQAKRQEWVYFSGQPAIKIDDWLNKPIKDWPSSDSRIVKIWIEESRHVWIKLRDVLELFSFD